VQVWPGAPLHRPEAGKHYLSSYITSPIRVT